MREKWYKLKIEDVINQLKTDIKVGLNTNEVQKRKDKYGENTIEETNRRSIFQMLIDQFKDFMIIILLLAALVSGFLGELKDSIVILIIIILNAVLGVVQENKAENSLQALRALDTPSAQVLRDERWIEIDSRDLVPGDIVNLGVGDAVPADLRIISSDGLEVQEAALTGESVAVQKDADVILEDEVALGDQTNMLFKGTTVQSGQAKALVVATAMDTEFGKIAEMIQAVDQQQTPLQKRLERLGKKLGIGALFLSAIVSILGIIQGEEPFTMFMTGVSLAVAAIPEGLPAIVTIVLALGMQRMIKNNAIIRRLPAVETLGSATAICTDKTGTLTQNKMVAREVTLPDYEEIKVGGDGYAPKGSFTVDGKEINSDFKLSLKLLFKTCLLCNNSKLSKTEKGDWQVLGDPTEGALLVLGSKSGINREELINSYDKKREIEFNSKRKIMSVIYQTEASKVEVYTKGAPDVILEKANLIYTANGIDKLSDDKREELLKLNEELASKGRRILGIAWRQLDDYSSDLKDEEIETDLVFVGFVAMIDPPRPEVKEAIDQCKRAGIKPIMITGDHKATALAIAEEIGLTNKGNLALSGPELEEMITAEFEQRVNKVRVYARVSPEHKVRIVKNLQKRGNVVAMTGDGVNDAPALKNADIGTAMGKKGTDVAKESADMVLTDDNFATIITAVKEGRRIFDNIKRSIQFLLSCNLGEVFTLLVALIIGFQRPLIPIQILWINLVTDSLPAISLGLEEAEQEIMDRPPRAPDSGVFSKQDTYSTIAQGVLIGTLALLGYWIGLQRGGLVKAQTMTFATLAFAQLFHTFNLRSKASLMEIGFFSNRYLVIGVVVSILLQLAVLLVPFLQKIFEVITLSGIDWLIIGGLAILPIIIVEIFKQIL
ncbi:MAG: Ca2+-transporting ATPase [Candidatus Frackibacter sp. T328-2]|nr:MAG: Ca2+-transporting ATPase [Candidatus Frackibacter sp. T328-2]